jgi:hypothetical protein
MDWYCLNPFPYSISFSPSDVRYNWWNSLICHNVLDSNKFKSFGLPPLSYQGFHTRANELNNHRWTLEYWSQHIPSHNAKRYAFFWYSHCYLQDYFLSLPNRILDTWSKHTHWHNQHFASQAIVGFVDGWDSVGWVFHSQWYCLTSLTWVWISHFWYLSSRSWGIPSVISCYPGYSRLRWKYNCWNQLWRWSVEIGYWTHRQYPID